jgi:hypothetical protein
VNRGKNRRCEGNIGREVPRVMRQMWACRGADVLLVKEIVFPEDRAIVDDSLDRDVGIYVVKEDRM